MSKGTKYRQFEQLDLPAIDQEILAFWAEEKIFEKSVSSRPFHTMLGKRVERKGGWDTHGLPIELSVEKELGITKEDIGKSITIEEYNAKCRETVMRYKALWDDITLKMGYWVDLDNPYVTYENDYIETVWHLLSRLYEKDLIYKGYTIQPFSPAAGTGLSSHELNQPGCYRNVKDTSAVAQFKIIRDEKSESIFEGDENLHFIAWTTTPWTLPSNTALAVGAKIKYVKVRTFNPYTFKPVSLILAEDLLGKWFESENQSSDLKSYVEGDKNIPYNVTSHYTAQQLEGIRYEQLLNYAQPKDGDAFKVLIGDFVTTEDGTGIVHLAPSFGADDMRVAKKFGIGSLTLVDKQGKFTDEMGEFAGRYVKDYKDDPDYVNVDIDIAVKLKKENKAFNVQKYEHNYPHCWRTDKPILYYPLDSWFIKASSARERMKELNNTINWKPASTGEKRFGNWLENLQDWNLSRSRFWGIPLPIWRTKDGGEQICIGSVEQLRSEVARSVEAGHMAGQLPDGFDLHRPFIDDVVLTSSSGEPMKREMDLIDVWFDSGSMPYAQWHYPFENEEIFMRNFPADFIAEGVDQTRGWFYTLHAIAVMLFDSVAYKNVVSNGLVLDKEGKKMSKRWGNAVDPFETIAKYGADATRWYMISNTAPWDNLKFDIEGLDEVRRKFFGTLYNTYSFFSLYANIDGFDYSEEKIALSERPEIDRWILSSLNTLILMVREDYNNYEPTNAARRIQKFLDEQLSNWYVRLCRRRFWRGDYGPDKISAYQTLYDCLIAISKLSAPIAPFFSDWLFKNLNDATQKEQVPSIHLAQFPLADESLIDASLETRMNYAQGISSLGRSLRKKEKIRVRQPLSRILLPVLDPAYKEQVLAVEGLIKNELNIKEIEFVDDASGIIKKRIKPNFKTLGKRLGKHMKTVATQIASFGVDEIQQIEKTGSYEMSIDGENHILTLEDFEISSEDIPGWSVANEGNLTVALDVTLNEGLILEGNARELVNRIQKIRKETGLEVTDRISIEVEENQKLEQTISEFGDYIKEETLADSILVQSSLENAELIDFPDETTFKILIRAIR